MAAQSPRTRSSSTPSAKHHALRKSRSARTQHVMPEPLEGRTLFSNIVWVDRGGAGGSGTDSDNFQAMYGGNAGLARSIVDTAINYWEQVIVDFNWDDGQTQYDLYLSAGQLDDSKITRGETSGVDDDSDDTPYSGDIVMDDNGGGLGWFFDTTPNLSEEFNVVDRDTALPGPTVNGFDYMRTVLHEIGHAVGYDESADWFEADDLKIGDYLYDAGTDQVAGSGTIYVFKATENSAPLATFTDVGGLHMYEGAPDPNSDYPGAPSTSNDLMNPGRSIVMGTRQLISDLDTQVLAAAYGYTVKLPSTIAGFNYLTSFNPATGTLTVNGDPEAPDGNDSVVITRVGGAIGVQVNTHQMLFDPAAVKQIGLSLGTGDDTVTVNSSAGNPYPDNGIIYNGGVGDNSLYVFGPQVAASYTVDPANVTVDQGNINYSGVQHLFVVADSATANNGMSVLGSASDTQDLHVIGSAGGDTVRVDGLWSTTSLEVDTLGGSDTLYMSFLDNDLDAVSGTVVINAGEDAGDDDTDTLNIWDGQDVSDNDYTVGPDTTNDGALLRNTQLAVFFNGVEGFELQAGGGDDDIYITGTPPDTSMKVTGGLGTDRVWVDSNTTGTGGTVDQVVHHLEILGGNAGNDLLVLNDAGDTGANQLTVEDGKIRSATSGSFFGPGGGIDYDQFEQLNLNLGTGHDGVAVRSTGPGTDTIIAGGEGDDTVTVGSAAATVYDVQSHLYVNGGAGQDDVILNDAGDATADTVTITHETVGAAAGDTYFGPGGKLTYFDLESLALNLGTGADAVNVLSTDADTSLVVNAGDGDDTVTVDSNGAATGGDVADILGGVTVNGQAGGAHLTIDNSGGAADGDVVTVTATAVGAQAGDTFFPAGGSVSYAGLTGLTVNAADGPDAIFVRGTASGTSTTVNAAAGADALKVSSTGNGPNGTANDVLSPLTFNGGAGNDSVVVEDAADPTPSTVTITANSVAGCFSPAGSLAYNDVASLTVNLGTGGNTVVIASTASGTTTAVNTGSGSDTISVDSNGAAAGGSVDNVVSDLAVDGQGGTNTLTLEDSSDQSADVVNITPTEVGAAAGDTFFGAGGRLTFAGVNVLNMKMPSAALGDTMYWTPSTTTELHVNGNEPSGSTGGTADVLTMNLTGIATRKFTKLGRNAGRWDFDGRQSLLFSNVEIVNSAG
jgi:hypothetical protein